MKKNKKLKGMTLVECITALAVLAVFTTAIATSATALSKMKINSNNIIKQTSYQAPIADNRKTDSSLVEEKATTEVISVQASGFDKKEYYSNRYAVNVNPDEAEKESQTKGLYDGSERRFQFYDKIEPTTTTG